MTENVKDEIIFDHNDDGVSRRGFLQCMAWELDRDWRTTIRFNTCSRKKTHMTNTLRIFGLTASVVISLALLACGQKTQSAASGNSSVSSAENQSASATPVKIDNFSFTPQALTVSAGATVTWTNSDDVPHNVVSTDKVFKSKTMDTDEKFSYTFTKPGTYNYYCSIHPRMTATVVVK